MAIAMDLGLAFRSLRSFQGTVVWSLVTESVNQIHTSTADILSFSAD